MPAINYTESYKLALDAIMAYLTGATGMPEKPNGQGNAHRFYLPPAIDVFGVWLGDSRGRVEHTKSLTPGGGGAGKIHMPCSVIARFMGTDRAQEFTMQIIEGLPLRDHHGTNIHYLGQATGGAPHIDWVKERLANDQKETILFEVTLTLEAVFSTKEKYA